MGTQINNLRIKWNRSRQQWQVLAPDDRVLEEFTHNIDAWKWAEKTKDFTRK